MGWWLGLAPVTLEFWVRFPNERNQGKQAHPVLKYRVPHGSQPRPGWAPDPLMVGIRSPDGLVVGSCTSQPGVLGLIPKREEPGKTGAPCIKVPGSSRVPHANSFIIGPAVIKHTHQNTHISFLPAIMSTSNRMHGEFLRLLFLQAHRETEAHFTAAGMPSQRNQSESFRFKRAAFYQGLKSKVGLAAAKAAALRINLNVQGCSIVAAPMHAPSRTSLLLPLLLSHNLPLPRVH
jgi:hypothetical protein